MGMASGGVVQGVVGGVVGTLNIKKKKKDLLNEEIKYR